MKLDLKKVDVVVASFISFLLAFTVSFQGLTGIYPVFLVFTAFNLVLPSFTLVLL